MEKRFHQFYGVPLHGYGLDPKNIRAKETIGNPIFAALILWQAFHTDTDSTQFSFQTHEQAKRRHAIAHNKT